MKCFLRSIEMRSIVIVIAILISPVTLLAAPIQWSVNGHYYEAVPSEPIPWLDAKVLAANKVYAGLTGHLATITSAAEQEFLYTYVFPEVGYWAGGYQDPPDSSLDENWHWITGEAWSYTKWAPGEPNDFWGEHSENFLEVSTYGWNDFPGSGWGGAGYIKGYVVEYEARTVPEPATLLLVGSGLVGVLGLAGQHRRG